MSNSLDPDQARHFVGPGLGPNWLQRLIADDTSRQRVKNVIYNSQQTICLKWLFNIRPPDKIVYLKKYCLIPQPKHMLWVLDSSFEQPKQMLKLMDRKIFRILRSKFCLSVLMASYAY